VSQRNNIKIAESIIKALDYILTALSKKRQEFHGSSDGSGACSHLFASLFTLEMELLVPLLYNLLEISFK
jgi:hypothetical protein